MKLMIYRMYRPKISLMCVSDPYLVSNYRKELTNIMDKLILKSYILTSYSEG